jgi:hypothetical protein
MEMARTDVTTSIAYAAGLDAGNRSMREAGRTKWSPEDAERASEATQRLLSLVPLEQGGTLGLTA